MSKKQKSLCTFRGITGGRYRCLQTKEVTGSPKQYKRKYLGGLEKKVPLKGKQTTAVKPKKKVRVFFTGY